MKKIILVSAALITISLVIGAIYINSNIEDRENTENEISRVIKGDLDIDVITTGEVVPVSGGEMIISAVVDEYEVIKVKEGQKVILNFTAFPYEDINGVVQRVSDTGQIINGTGKFLVSIDGFSQLDGLRVGMTATATILTDKKEGVLKVPIEAVKKDNEDNYYVVLKNDDVKRKITLGESNDEFVEVLEGIKEGEEIKLPQKNIYEEIKSNLF